MVTSVYGDIEGHRIIFSLSEGNFWQATVPAMPTGEYVTALYCRNDAGLETYYGTILYVVDVERLSYEVRMLDYAADCRADPAGMYYIGKIEVEDLRHEAEAQEYKADPNTEQYYIGKVDVSGKAVYFDKD